MDQPGVFDVVARVTQVAAYGNQIGSIFHQYDSTEMNTPCGFESTSKLVNATTTALGQIIKLLNEEAETAKKGSGRSLFSHDGLQYVYNLATECGKDMFFIEQAILGGPKRDKVVKAKSKRSTTKTHSQTVNFAKLELQDERVFLDKVESARLVFDSDRMDRITDKIYDIQLHALLFFQVITVGKLSKDFSSGKVDVQSIAAFHKRITLTADMAGIINMSSRSRNRYNNNSDYSSLSSSSSSDPSDSDSDASVFASRNRRTGTTTSKGPRMFNPPTPPPPPPPAPQALQSPVHWRGIPPPPELIICRPQNQDVPGLATPQTPSQKSPTIESSNPPSYSYCGSSRDFAAPVKSGPGGHLTSNAAANEMSATILPASSDKKSSPDSIISKKKVLIDRSEASDPKAIEPTIPNAQLFKSKSSSFSFKIRSMFRSKQSLASEMRMTLESSQYRLSAFLIQGNGSRLVPHSVFHSLETTHMRTILAQIDNKEWYKTFTGLTSAESYTVERVLCMNGPRSSHQAELVVLKVVKENRLYEWLALLNKVRNQAPFVLMNDGRVILAIVRGKIQEIPPPMPKVRVEGRSTPREAPMPLPRTLPPNIRLPPSSLPSQARNKISDLRFPPPGMPRPGPGPPPPPSNHGPSPLLGPPVKHIGAGVGPPPPPPPPHNPIHPPVLMSHTPGYFAAMNLAQNDEDALLALTEYVEYTLRPCAPLEVETSRTWDRCSITQESSPRNIVISRIHSFKLAGGNVIDVKLSLTDRESQQVTRLIDVLKLYEQDSRFEWCWEEISKHGRRGEITDFRRKRGDNRSLASDSDSNSDSEYEIDISKVTMIHLIAKRAPKGHIKPLLLYNNIINNPPPPPRPPGWPQFPRPGPPGGPPGPANYHKPPPPPASVNAWRVGKPAKKGAGHPKPKKKAKKPVSESETESGSGSGSDSEGSETQAKANKTFKLNFKLKRGDDVVKILLDMWTPQSGNGEVEELGKGKEKQTGTGEKTA